jgi:hypothetical protein
MPHRLLSVPLATVLAAGAFAAPALAGTDGDPSPAPAIPPAPATVPVVPAPTPVAPEIPRAEVEQATRHHAPQRSSRAGGAHATSTVHQHQTVVHTRRTSAVVHAVLTSATPTGGVQAGEGGTAVRPGDGGGLILLAPGVLALLALAGTGLRATHSRR